MGSNNALFLFVEMLKVALRWRAGLPPGGFFAGSAALAGYRYPEFRYPGP